MSKNYEYDALMEEIRKKALHCWGNCITMSSIEEWLCNFTGRIFDIDEERIMALRLLNSFIYLSHNEVLHLCKVIHQEFLHSLIVNGYCESDIADKIRYFPIGNPSESSSLILYFYRLANNIPKDKFSNIPRNNNGELIVFVDDISGSGHQASSHIIELMQKENISPKSIKYLSLIATDAAIDIFRTNGLELISAFNIDSRMRVFSDDSYTAFDQQTIINMKCLLQAYEDRLEWDPLGYSKSELALGFYYNVPDNTLPIFWKESKLWTPLFKRFHKIYSSNNYEEVFHESTKFI